MNPRKRGPILFWFALATMVVALGALAVVDLAGASVAPSAYPATVLGLSAAFLLLGSFFGRAGGLILVGLLAAAATVGATFADHWDPHREVVRPVSAAGVASSYTMGVGETIVDLTDVRDPQSLDGRLITVTGNLGHLEVDVPNDMTVVARTHVTGAGGINAFGRDGGGVDTRLTAVHTAGPHAARLTLDITLHIGGIDVHTEPALRKLTMTDYQTEPLEPFSEPGDAEPGPVTGRPARLASTPSTSCTWSWAWRSPASWSSGLSSRAVPPAPPTCGGCCRSRGWRPVSPGWSRPRRACADRATRAARRAPGSPRCPGPGRSRRSTRSSCGAGLSRIRRTRDGRRR